MNLTFFNLEREELWKTTTARSTSDLSPKHQTSEISLKTSEVATLVVTQTGNCSSCRQDIVHRTNFGVLRVTKLWCVMFTRDCFSMKTKRLVKSAFPKALMTQRLYQGSLSSSSITCVQWHV